MGQTRDRETAYRALINAYLKGQGNFEECHKIVEQNKMRKDACKDCFGGTRENPKDLRIGLSLPPQLYYMLQRFERTHDREFMQTKEDLRWFARKFPVFTIAERI